MGSVGRAGLQARPTAWVSCATEKVHAGGTPGPFPKQTTPLDPLGVALLLLHLGPAPSCTLKPVAWEREPSILQFGSTDLSSSPSSAYDEPGGCTLGLLFSCL